MTLHAEQRDALASLDQVMGDWRDRVGRTLQAAESGDFDAAREEARQNGKNAAQIVAALVRLRDVFDAAGSAAVKRADQEQQRMWTLIATIVALAAVAGLVMGVVIAGQVARPILRVGGAMDRMAAGDFSTPVEVESRDELGLMAAAVNRAMEGMRQSLTEVRAAASTIAQASHELQQSSSAIASGAQEQAAKLEGIMVQITRKAGVDGRLFGSVTNFDIAEALKGLGHEVEKADIRMPQGPLKMIGDTQLQIALHSDVVVNITVSVLGEH